LRKVENKADKRSLSDDSESDSEVPPLADLSEDEPQLDDLQDLSSMQDLSDMQTDNTDNTDHQDEQDELEQDQKENQ